MLHDIAFRLEPGKVLGVLGRTGSGKTTLTRLLFRLYDPSAGAIRLGGVDIRDVSLADLRGRSRHGHAGCAAVPGQRPRQPDALQPAHPRRGRF